MNRIIFSVLLFGISLQSCLKQDAIITSQQQLKLDTASISSFLKSNNIQVIKASTGFWYFIDTIGLGIYPVLSDSVTISYTAKRILNSSLTEVDNSDSTTVLLS